MALVILVTVPSFAQEVGSPSLARDIGFNTTFIFEGIFNSTVTPFSLFYKKYTSENKANRFGLEVYMNFYNENNNQGTADYSEYSNAAISLNFGREIQKPITLKWTWFYGGDIVPFYDFNNNETFKGNLKYYTAKSSNFGLTLRPFIAIRYNINTRLYLSAEASINLRYRRSNQYSAFEQAGTEERDINANGLSFFAIPASGLFLFYRF